MRIHVFLDLDGTLFQTRSKCPPEAELSPAALRRDGTPLSFMTAQQTRLLEWLRSADHVIPTTARSIDAFRRVQLPFSSLAILDFGGVILLPDGSPDLEWDAFIRPQAHAVAPELRRRCDALRAFVETHQLGVNVRLINDLDLSLYLVMKHPEGNLDTLARIRREALADLDRERFFLHDNDNNLSVVPRFLGKERAVEHVIRRHLGDEPALTIGVGDSFSDAAFVGLCDYALLPRCSQLGEFLVRQWPLSDA
jgi:predicted mannosyl-3-phosphoglycerate phosphatase (HAD superfamily)